MGGSVKSSLGHQPRSLCPPAPPIPTPQPGAGPHVEGDGQREEVRGEVAEDAFEVVQITPFAAAVGGRPDEVATGRDVQATHVTTLQGGREEDIRGRHPEGRWTRTI